MLHRRLKPFVAEAALVTAIVAAITDARAQHFPVKSITLIVPWVAGCSTDIETERKVVGIIGLAKKSN